MLSWDDFRQVKAIADCGSLGGAAQAFGINHSTAFRRLGMVAGKTPQAPMSATSGLRIVDAAKGRVPTPPRRA